MSLTKNYSSLNVKQLKQLLEDVNDSQEVRIWVEMENNDGNTYLEGRRLCGTIDDPHDEYLCIVAGLYREEEE